MIDPEDDPADDDVAEQARKEIEEQAQADEYDHMLDR